MVSEKRLKVMIDLERYNKDHKGKSDAAYYKSDYIVVSLIKRFFMITLAYVLILALLALCNYNYITEEIVSVDLKQWGAVLVISYIALLAVYLGITIIAALVRYNRLKKNQKEYEHNLKKLDKMYYRESR